MVIPRTEIDCFCAQDPTRNCPEICGIPVPFPTANTQPAIHALAQTNDATATNIDGDRCEHAAHQNKNAVIAEKNQESIQRRRDCTHLWNVPDRASHTNVLTPTSPLAHRRSRKSSQPSINMRGADQIMERNAVSQHRLSASNSLRPIRRLKKQSDLRWLLASAGHDCAPTRLPRHHQLCRKPAAIALHATALQLPIPGPCRQHAQRCTRNQWRHRSGQGLRRRRSAGSTLA